MRLVLNNIRQHTELEINLPDSGVALLQGHSGAGKTTIFDAIEDALFGNGTDMITWGSSKGGLELEISKPAYLKITRTKTPYTLTVVDSTGATFKDDEGQQVINTVIGITESEFASCSYIRQGAAGSLLNLTPGEQLKFIQNLSDGIFSPEKMKESVTAAIKTEEKKLNEVTTQIGVLQEQSESTKKLTTDAKEPTTTKEDIQSVKENKLKFLNDIAGIEKELADYNKSLRSPYFSKKEKLEFLQKDFSQKRELRSKEIETLTLGVSDSVMTEPEVREKIDVATKKKNRISSLRQADVLKAELKEVFSEYNNERLTFFLDNKIELLTKQVEDSRLAIKTILAELASFVSPMECPACQQKLVLMNKKLVPPSIDSDEYNKKTAEASELSLSSASAQELLGKARKFKDRVLVLMSGVTKEDPAPNLKTDEECDAVIKFYNELSLNLVKSEKNKWKITSLNQQDVAEQSQLDSLQKELDSTAKPEPKEVLESLILKKTGQVFALKTLISGSEEILLAEKEWAAYDEKILSNQRVEKRVQGILSDMAERQSEAAKIHNRLTAAIRVKELSDFASVAAIESVIDTINCLAATYLDQLFEEDGTTIVLTNTSKTKAGDERAKIGVNIFHKGKQAKKLSNLSGGEKSRVCLAFQLALADMYNTPFLLVDEGFAGLDSDSKEKCLNVLRTVADKRSVLVVEHGAPESFFDEVIRVG